jgi:hypothetical protein
MNYNWAHNIEWFNMVFGGAHVMFWTERRGY